MLFEKTSINGKGPHPLYTSKKTNPGFSGRITRNFNKFLVSHDDRVVGRFGNRTKTADKKPVVAIEA